MTSLGIKILVRYVHVPCHKDEAALARKSSPMGVHVYPCLCAVIQVFYTTCCVDFHRSHVGRSVSSSFASHIYYRPGNPKSVVNLLLSLIDPTVLDRRLVRRESKLRSVDYWMMFLKREIRQ